MAYKFVCSHCGKSFELETTTAKECPFCYWSSSVKREDEIDPRGGKGAGRGNSHPLSADGKKATNAGLGGGASVFRIFLILILCAGLGVAGFLGYKAFVQSRSSDVSFMTIQPPSREKKITSQASSKTPEEELSPQEKEALFAEVNVSPERVPDAVEQEILSRVVQLETGWAEKIPSPGWTLEQYTQMIETQERSYKMPFARSYKKKLSELFQTQYLAGSEAFARGDLLAARDLWVGSLAFPLYSTDLRKHRAVALTMLRPFINDTLAKIAAANQSLADQDRRSKETLLNESYQKLAGLIAQKQWAEAFQMTADLESQVKQLQQGAKEQKEPPSYPASFGGVDQDIQRALMDLMRTNPGSVADLQPLQQDLVEKRDILQTFTPEYLKKVLIDYQNAVTLIREEKWEEALSALEAFSGPKALEEDAARKIAILKKIVSQQ